MVGTEHQAGTRELLHAEALLQARDLPAALESYLAAEREGADADVCASGRWMASMLAGEFAAAWAESDAIRARGAVDPHRFWTDEPLAGKRVIVRCLHGLGDAVQMLRYLPLLQSVCACIILEVPPSMLAIAACFAGADQVITWGADAPQTQPAWDLQVEVMELPYLFRTTLPDLPIACDYLRVPDVKIHEVARAMGMKTQARVGVVWSASPWDPTRRLPAECLAQLLATPGIEFWNLQGGEAHDLAVADKLSTGLRDAAELGDGLVPLAATVANLDLVISVDTLAAHMAGAMGQNAWVLLQHRADWRWMHDRDDSPWYPTLRLWRQTSQDDWSSLTARVCNALRNWSKT